MAGRSAFASAANNTPRGPNNITKEGAPRTTISATASQHGSNSNSHQKQQRTATRTHNPPPSDADGVNEEDLALMMNDVTSSGPQVNSHHGDTPHEGTPAVFVTARGDGDLEAIELLLQQAALLSSELEQST